MRIRKICREYGIKEPVFQEIAQGFQVVLFKETINDTINDTVSELNNVRDVTDNERNDIDIHADNVTDDTDKNKNDTDSDTDNANKIKNDIEDTDKIKNDTDNNRNDTDKIDNDTDRRKKIVQIIGNNKTVSILGLAQKLSVSKSTILRDVKMLKQKNILTRIGKEKNGHWEVKM